MYKFIALELVDNEVEWLRNFFVDIPLGVKLTLSLSMHCDCQTTIVIAKNKTCNGKNCHIRLRHKVINEIISINYVESKVNLTDPLTKETKKLATRASVSRTSLNWP